MAFAVRSIFNPNVTFPIDDRRATFELSCYGCVIIIGAGSSLAETSSVGKILRQNLAGITSTGDIPVDCDLQCIKKEFFLNKAVMGLMARTPGLDHLAIGSYQPMVVFHHHEAESTHLWYKDTHMQANVIGFQTLHLGADTARFSIGVYATAAPEGYDRNITTVAYGGDIVVYRGRIPRTTPNLLEPGNIGFAIKVSYIHLRDRTVIDPLPLPVVMRYIEEGGDSVSISQTSHAIMAPWGTHGLPQAGPASTHAFSQADPTWALRSYGTSSKHVLLALARQALLRGQRLNSTDGDLVGIIYRALKNESIMPADEILLSSITESCLSRVFWCPITGCSKNFVRRDDLVKHVRKPGATTESDQLPLHNELNVKYQGLELSCCGKAHKNVGMFLKHINIHGGTDPLQDLPLNQPGEYILLDANSYMTMKIQPKIQLQRGWRDVVM